MITRIEVDGFKSLREFAVDLEPLTILLGPNSAGKSNILDALALLSRLASMPISEAFKGGRGRSIDQFSRQGSEPVDTMRFAVELLEHGEYPAPLPDGVRPLLSNRLRYELMIQRVSARAGTERLVARDESLRIIRPEDDRWVASHSHLVPHTAQHAGQSEFRTDEHKGDRRILWSAPGAPQPSIVPSGYTAVGSLSNLGGSAIKAELSGFRLFDAGGVELGKASERIDSGPLERDASNLPTVLAELPAHLVGEIRADLVSLVPGVASFDTVPAEDEIQLDFELSGGGRMPARLMSAGTLRILALLTALRMNPRCHVLGIEEPENGIYPGRLRSLLELLREHTRRTYEQETSGHDDALERSDAGGSEVYHNLLPTQILLTTHSLVAVAALRSELNHLRFVDMVRRDGQRVTRVRAVARPGANAPQRTIISPREIDTLLRAARADSTEDLA